MLNSRGAVISRGVSDGKHISIDYRKWEPGNYYIDINVDVYDDPNGPAVSAVGPSFNQFAKLVVPQ